MNFIWINDSEKQRRVSDLLKDAGKEEICIGNEESVM